MGQAEVTPIKYALRQNVHQLLESGVIDPYRIADELITTIPRKAILDALHECLPHAIRVIIHAYRDATLRGADEEGDSPAIQQPSRWESVGPHPVYTPEYEARWTDLANLTADDCVRVAERYFKLANENNERGKRFMALAKSMRHRKVEKVGELPAFVVKNILGR